MSMQAVGERVRMALEASDLDAYKELLAPDVHWGPPDEPQSGCHNRREVLNWYRKARGEGMTAIVNEVVTGADCILVGISVHGSGSDEGDAGTALRWQVLTVRDGRIGNICGFDDRDEAAARAGIAT